MLPLLDCWWKDYELPILQSMRKRLAAGVDDEEDDIECDNEERPGAGMPLGLGGGNGFPSPFYSEKGII